MLLLLFCSGNMLVYCVPNKVLKAFRLLCQISISTVLLSVYLSTFNCITTSQHFEIQIILLYIYNFSLQTLYFTFMF